MRAIYNHCKLSSSKKSKNALQNYRGERITPCLKKKKSQAFQQHAINTWFRNLNLDIISCFPCLLVYLSKFVHSFLYISKVHISVLWQPLHEFSGKRVVHITLMQEERDDRAPVIFQVCPEFVGRVADDHQFMVLFPGTAGDLPPYVPEGKSALNAYFLPMKHEIHWT